MCPRSSSRVLTQSDKRQDSGDDDNCADDIDDAVHDFTFRARLEIKSRVKRNATRLHPILTILLSGKTLRAPARTSAIVLCPRWQAPPSPGVRVAAGDARPAATSQRRAGA